MVKINIIIILNAVLCWATSHLNAGAIIVNFVPSFGNKLIEISAKSDITGCSSVFTSLFATKQELNLCLYANHQLKALTVQKVKCISFHCVICTPFWTEKTVSVHRNQTDDSENFLTPH